MLFAAYDYPLCVIECAEHAQIECDASICELDGLILAWSRYELIDCLAGALIRKAIKCRSCVLVKDYREIIWKIIRAKNKGGCDKYVR